MHDFVNTDGLARLIRHELVRMSLPNRQHAYQSLKGRLGAYDLDDTVISAGIAAYYDHKYH